jgi:hypothetical protein
MLSTANDPVDRAKGFFKVFIALMITPAGA